MKQTIIGIDECNNGGAIGSLVYALVETDKETLKKIKNKFVFRKAKYLSENSIKNIVHYAVDEGVIFDIVKIPANLVGLTPCLYKTQCTAIMELLNNVYKFPEKEVYIDNFIHTRKNFMDYFRQALPKNLQDHKFLKLHVMTKGERYDIVKLADLFAKYFFIKEMKQNKLIYGIDKCNADDFEVIRYFLDNWERPTKIMNLRTKLYKKMFSKKNRTNYEKLLKG